MCFMSANDSRQMDTIGAAAERRTAIQCAPFLLHRIADAERFVLDSDRRRPDVEQVFTTAARPELEEIRGNMQRLAEAITVEGVAKGWKDVSCEVYEDSFFC